MALVQSIEREIAHGGRRLEQDRHLQDAITLTKRSASTRRGLLQRARHATIHVLPCLQIWSWPCSDGREGCATATDEVLLT
jgi:hypothetical protein